MIQARVWLTILCASFAAAACSGEGDGDSENSAGSGNQNNANGGSGNQNTGNGGSSNTSNGGSQGNGATGGFGTTGSQTGLTPCGNFPDLQDKFCQPGQYCVDQSFSECVSGCLNNGNCASDQTCIKDAGENVGTCQNNSSGISCDDVCDRVLACDPVTPRSQCVQDCAGFNDECKSCLMDVNCNEAPDCWEACGLL